MLHLNTIPERFGLVLAEANAAGVPVIAMDLGSCREVIEDGQTGFLVDDVDEAVRAPGTASRNRSQSPAAQRVQQCFSIETMVEAYERVYATIFELEAKKQIMKPDIVRRYRHNPILTKAEIPYPVETVHNAAVVKHGERIHHALPLASAHGPLDHRPGAQPRRIPTSRPIRSPF